MAIQKSSTKYKEATKEAYRFRRTLLNHKTPSQVLSPATKFYTVAKKIVNALPITRTADNCYLTFAFKLSTELPFSFISLFESFFVAGNKKAANFLHKYIKSIRHTHMEATLKNRSTVLFNKVPQVTFFFWIIKVLCTTVGETFADFLNVNLNFGLTGTSVVMGIFLLVALFFQNRAKKYVPVIYWVTVVFISVFGTLVTDILTDQIGVPLETSTVVFSVLLLLSFALWYAKEKTLSIHSIYTKRREFFYWLTVLFTFALGTAAGDLMAESLGLGYLVTGIIVAVIIAIVIIARQLKLNSVLSFWIIYILTRPLGASIGDLLSQPTKYGGLGLGATLTSVLFLAGIFAIIVYFSFAKKDIEETAVPETADDSGNGLIWQSVITVAVFVIAGIFSYYWRHASLQKDVPVAAATTIKGDTSKSGAVTTNPLGDLSIFTAIAADSRQMVASNNLDAAKIRVADLEHEWDQAEGKLKAMNGARWTQVDDAIDKVLRQLRGVNPTQQGSAAALDALLEVLK